MIFALGGVTVERSEGDGIDSVEAKRSPLSPNFNLEHFNRKNSETTAIKRTIRHRSGHSAVS
ncbi:hypothetical protein NST33_11370 [Paenibacillus sp. FSL L8-0435]|uniref:hypothetical protein n=1 Tax=Paenibacillus TaxID=44249 RepID=UPI001C8E0570|nr:hypothetical protein [Paenibacillus xylanexedens]MBY0118932.1 hypothetical protein [Paenibacillus xylanexedens]